MPKQILSVVINTSNSASTLARTLESVKFADEIVIVDAHSTDETVKIAKQYTKRIYFFEGPNYVEPYRNFALGKAKHPWILVVDADEVIANELQQIILETIAEPQAEAYFLPRKNFIFGNWITKASWWPDYQLRLFKNGAVRWQAEIHSIPQVEGQTAHLPAEEKYAIVHYNYTDVAQFIDRLNNYTTIQAQERTKRSSLGDFSAEQLFGAFANEFASRALVHDGVADGLHGVSLSLLQAFSELVVYLKQWEAVGFTPTSQEDLGEILQQMQQIWRYWWADYQVRHTTGWRQLYWRARRKFKL